MDFTDAAEGEQVNRVMDNLLTVSYQEAEYSGSQRILDGDVFNYFRSISALCNDEQKKQLSNILKKARHRGRGGAHGPPRHKKR